MDHLPPKRASSNCGFVLSGADVRDPTELVCASNGVRCSNVLFTQLLEDEATFESFLDTFLDDSQLTPKQRDSYVDRLKAEYGEVTRSKRH